MNLIIMWVELVLKAVPLGLAAGPWPHVTLNCLLVVELRGLGGAGISNCSGGFNLRDNFEEFVVLNNCKKKLSQKHLGEWK